MKRIYFALLLIAVLASCSPMRFTTRTRGGDYTRETPVAVIPFHDASAFGTDELYNQLDKYGFDVVTYYNRRKGDEYVLEINCSLEPDTANTYSTFTASLAEGKSGRILLRATQRRPRDARATMRDLVKKMSQVIKP